MRDWLKRNRHKVSFVVGAAVGAACMFMSPPYNAVCELVARGINAMGGAQ